MCCSYVTVWMGFAVVEGQKVYIAFGAFKVQVMTFLEMRGELQTSKDFSYVIKGHYFYCYSWYGFVSYFIIPVYTF